MYVVLKQQLGVQVYKMVSATAYKIVVQTIGNGYKKEALSKRELEVDKEDVLYSSCKFKDCLEYVWGK